MRLIGISDNLGQLRVEFAGCNMRCPYCVHIRQPMKEYSIEDVVDLAKRSESEDVYLGGAEPTLQKDLLPLIEGLHAAGKSILLKSNGMKPDVLEKALPFVKGFVIEIKAPLDDIPAIMELTGLSEERSIKYISLLRESLNIAKQKWLRVWIRVIPGFINTGTIARILPDIGEASEVMLYQFMSNPDFDLPFKGHDKPTPEWDEVRKLGEMLLEKVQKVRIVGDGGKLLLENN
ncbi:radical SAM protein [Methanococcoides sp. NM1]|uniref:radical SAM protein n=1 Tax=Methanococcoides sp. NM1 TaxID=1201013 RepID=UPI001082327C|nr:radical SAM protein [Methanococcoides sp. NM1]